MKPDSEKDDHSREFDLGRSLVVPIVQELSRESDEIPDRYVRLVDNKDDQPVITGELPVIDMSKLLDLEFYDAEELSKLGYACREWGFFQLVNHGISERVVEKTKEDIIKFFKLPLEQREEVRQMPGQIEGYGQMFVHSEEQKLDWADALILGTQPAENRDMRFWPTNPSTFRDTLDTYVSEMTKIADCIFKMMSMDLGISPKIMLELFSGQKQSVRINYYPSCKEANKVIGLSPHSDGDALTILLQANDVNGLQIKKNGKWFLVKPIPKAFIINIGDILEIITNGIYKSIEHRAIVNTEEERLSIATFQFPRLDTMLLPFPELVKDDGELYRRISFKEYTKEYFAGKLSGKNTLEDMKLRK